MQASREAAGFMDKLPPILSVLQLTLHVRPLTTRVPEVQAADARAKAAQPARISSNNILSFGVQQKKATLRRRQNRSIRVTAGGQIYTLGDSKHLSS
jgi:hypothetical protein